MLTNDKPRFQFALDTTPLRPCLAAMFDVSEDEVNVTHLEHAGIEIGLEVNNCTQSGRPTSHFPQASGKGVKSTKVINSTGNLRCASKLIFVIFSI